MIQAYFNQIKVIVDQYAVTRFVLDANVSFETRPGDQGYLTGSITFKGMSLRLIWASGKGFEKEQIVFHRVGKKSAAHFKAYGIYKGFRKADRILTAEDILALIQ